LKLLGESVTIGNATIGVKNALGDCAHYLTPKYVWKELWQLHT
jgi:hypothetical protein